jgi:'Paired box' domain
MDGQAVFGRPSGTHGAGGRGGRSRHEVARIFAVSASCVIKLMQRYQSTGDYRALEFGGHKKPALAEHEETVRPGRGEAPDDIGASRRVGRTRDRSQPLLG